MEHPYPDKFAMTFPFPEMYFRTRNGRDVILTRPYVVVLGMGSTWYNVHIPEGFESDYASVPRFLWRIVPPFGRYACAALVHDYLYRNKKYSRKVCDDIFSHMMKSLNTKPWRRVLMYRAVRMMGWRYYGKGIKR